MSVKAARVFVILVAVGLALAAVTFGIKLVVPATVSSSVSPQLATASDASFPVVVNETGTVVLGSETDLNFTVPGMISTISAKVGQFVAKGTVLATLDNTSAQSALSQAQANLSSAQATLNAAENPLTPAQSASLQTALANAEQVQNDTISSVQNTASIDAENIANDQTSLSTAQSNFNTANCSSATNSTSSICQSYQSQITQDQHQLTLDQERSQTDSAAGTLRENEAQGQVNAAQSALNAASSQNPAQVSQAQASVASANAALLAAQSRAGQYSLVAPVGATVVAINGQVGQTVSGSAAVTVTLPGLSTPLSSAGVQGAGGQPPFIVLGVPTNLMVGFSFPSTDFGQVKVGQSGQLTSPTLTALDVRGNVLAVSGTPITVSGVPSYFATFAPNTNSGLQPGATVSVSVFVAQAKSVLAIPASAVYLLGGVPHVDVWNGTQAIPTSITTGLQGTSLVEVTAGLRSGQQVELVANQGFAQAGLP